MPFIWDWIWEKLSGVSKTSTQPQVMGRAEVDNQVREEIVRDGRKIPAKKSNTGAKPTRIRSDNTSKTGRKSPGKAVRATATKGKAKSKALSKG
jgi:hypothetical protein